MEHRCAGGMEHTGAGGKDNGTHRCGGGGQWNTQVPVVVIEHRWGAMEHRCGVRTMEHRCGGKDNGTHRCGEGNGTHRWG